MSVTGMCFFFRGSCLVWGRVSRHLDEEGYERRLTDLSVGEWAVCVLCVCVCVCVLLCVCVTVISSAVRGTRECVFPSMECV